MSSPAAAAKVYEVEAYNVSHASENKIHDDTVAKRFGFVGGLVPGVEVYAYACHAAVAHWGRKWLERGSMECRFAKPVYDGRIAQVSAAMEGDAALVIQVTSEGVDCAAATARLHAAPVMPAGWPSLVPSNPPATEARPAATETTLAVGRQLGAIGYRATPEIAAQYLADVREPDVLYSREGLLHPGLLLRLCNSALKDNVLLPPWVHVGSKVYNCAAAHVDARLGANARVAANYERRGHRLVDLEVDVLADDRVVARVLHTAIYRLRGDRE